MAAYAKRPPTYLPLESGSIKAAAESTDKVIVSASIYTAPVANKNERAAEMPPVAISFVEILLFISSKE